MNCNKILDILKKLKPCVFNYKWEKDKKTFGFIAQDLLQMFPDSEFTIVKKDDNNIYMVDYCQLIPILCTGIHDLQKRVIILEEELNKCQK